MLYSAPILCYSTHDNLLCVLPSYKMDYSSQWTAIILMYLHHLGTFPPRIQRKLHSAGHRDIQWITEILWTFSSNEYFLYIVYPAVVLKYLLCPPALGMSSALALKLPCKVLGTDTAVVHPETMTRRRMKHRVPGCYCYTATHHCCSSWIHGFAPQLFISTALRKTYSTYDNCNSK